MNDGKKEKMKILVNDEEVQFSGESLADLLKNHGFIESHGIAVAVNEKVIPGGEWGSCVLNQGDSVLVITPAQGG